MTTHAKFARCKRISYALLALFLVGIACGVPGASPSDPAVQEPVVVEGLTFQGYLGMIKAIQRPEAIPPWIVSPIPPPQGGGTISFNGWGPNQGDMKSNEPPTIVLHEVFPNGCGKGFTLGNELGKTTINGDEHRWYISDVQISPEVTLVGAVVVSGGKKGPLGNLLVFNSERLKPKITKPQVGAGPMISSDFSGEAFRGLCLSLWRGDQLLGRATVDTNGKWSIPTIPLKLGENFIVLRVEQFNDLQVNQTVKGPNSPNIAWPFGADENGQYKGYITAWFGPNDYYKKMYAARELSTDFHVGIDIGGVKGETVMSVASGTIKELQSKDENSCGIYVTIEHQGGWVSTYCHLKSINSKLTKDKEYPTGTPLGIVGCTGITKSGKRTCFGDHLHLQLRWRNGQLVNLNPSAGTPFSNGETYDLKYCASTLDVWELDWSKVTVQSGDGTSFEQLSCPANQICTCVKK